MFTYSLPFLITLACTFPLVSAFPFLNRFEAWYSGRPSHERLASQVPISSQLGCDKPQFNVSDDVHINRQFNYVNEEKEIVDIFKGAYRDLVEVLDVLLADGGVHQPTFERYFDWGDRDGVIRTFRTVSRMASDRGYFPAPFGISPLDLRGIQVKKVSEKGLILAAAGNVKRNTMNDPQIFVYDLGWKGLWRLLKDDIQCVDIGPTTNWKMHFLGTLLLHETLHFHSVSNLAWPSQDPDNPFVPENEVIDDQPGGFPLLGKAYGPYESMQLLGRSRQAALRNIENYVWFALENFWIQRCGDRRPQGSVVWGTPTNNDVWNLFCRVAEGNKPESCAIL